MENEDEIIDSTNDETDLQEQETISEDIYNESEDVDALKEKNRQLFARAKKAEVELKNLKTQPKQEAKKESIGDISKHVEAVMEKRELEDLDLDESLKTEVQNYAKLNGVSIKKAIASDYISFLKDKQEKKQRVEDASLGNKSRATVKKDYSSMNPSDLDMRSEEGQKDFKKWEEHIKGELG